jgi:hypothetical protein
VFLLKKDFSGGKRSSFVCLTVSDGFALALFVPPLIIEALFKMIYSIADGGMR